MANSFPMLVDVQTQVQAPAARVWRANRLACNAERCEKHNASDMQQYKNEMQEMECYNAFCSVPYPPSEHEQKQLVKRGPAFYLADKRIFTARPALGQSGRRQDYNTDL